MLRNRLVIAAALTLAVASSAAAQSSSTGTTNTQTTTGTTASTTQPTTSGSTSGDVQTRPATTTFMGDTGLWYVPTGEVLPRKKWSIKVTAHLVLPNV